MDTVDRFFFQEVSASGFGLMRIAWAACVLAFMLGSAGDIVRYYSDVGIMPSELGHLVFRTEYRFTLLSYITDPTGVVVLWSVCMLSLVLMMIGLWPRLMTVTSVLLLFSFHERNLQPLGGGDTVLRNIGFLLMIAPEVSAYSLSRLKDQWKHWQKTGKYLKPLRTHIWPYRLLLWQIIVIYLLSGLDKIQGDMWLNGTTVQAVFHHTHFARFSKGFIDSISWISPFACLYTIMFEFSWLLMLVPKPMWHTAFPKIAGRRSLKRWLIAMGLIFHWGIFVVLDVGAFPFALSVAYIGLLLDDDIAVLIKRINKRWKGKIVILYDGICNLCRRSIFFVGLADQLSRTKPVDFRDENNRQRHAPGIDEDDLDRAMHIKLPSGKYYKGFDAFRALCWHLPALLWLAPLLYIPRVPPVGRVIYQKIAESRNRCANGVCLHKPK